MKVAQPKKPKLVTDPGTKLTDLASKAASEDTAQGFMNPVRKRGRPRKNDTMESLDTPHSLGLSQAQSPSPEQQIEANKKLVRPMWELVERAGIKVAETEEAAMGPELLNTLVDTSAACIHQYLPTLLSEHANLIVLSVTFGSWGMKVYLLRQAKLAEMQQRARQMREARGESTITGVEGLQAH